MSYRSVLGGLALTALVTGLAGCSDDSTNISATNTTDNGQKVRVIGRVMNAQTFAGVSGATVEICGITKGSTDGLGNFVIDIAGNFSLPFGGFLFNENDSATTFFIVKISKPGMATIFTDANFYNDETPMSFGDSSAIEQDPGMRSTTVIDLGTQGMNTGFTQQIVVTRDGAPLANARVAVFSGNAFVRAQNGNGSTEVEQYFPTEASCFDDQSTTTNGDGIASFSDLDPFHAYTVIVPAQDLDHDTAGTFDFQTEVEGFNVQGTGGVYALDVDGTSFFTGDVSITDDTAVDFASISFDRGVISNLTSSAVLLGSSLTGIGNLEQVTVTAGLDFSQDNVADRFGTDLIDSEESWSEFVTSPNGALSFVFRTPVNVVQGVAGREVSFLYFDNMADPSAPATFNKLHVVTGTAESLTSALGTIWTFTPSETLPAYTLYRVEFLAHNTADPGRTQAIGRDYFRIPVDLSTTIDVKADNYNGTTNGNGESARVFLDFDRIVHGSYHVISVTDNNDVASFGSSAGVSSIEGELRSIVRNIDVTTSATDTDNRQLGVSSGFRYRVNLRANGSSTFLEDNRAGFTNSVRVGIVAEDIKGNKIDTILELPVR